MEVFPLKGTNLIQWEANVMDQFWFHAEISVHDFKIYFTNDQAVASRLAGILKNARDLNPEFLSDGQGCLVKSNINFNRYWGLGTSSSLISNIAHWSETDPFELHRNISKGSGFDIACARAGSPITFQLLDGNPDVKSISFNPPFKDQIYFAYLGEKQDSEESVIDFLGKKPALELDMESISLITDQMVETTKSDDFISLIEQHEAIISGVLDQPPIKERMFNDIPLSVKSLGAWGGDFIMIVWKGEEQKLLEYLKKKDIFTVFGFDELILQP